MDRLRPSCLLPPRSSLIVASCVSSAITSYAFFSYRRSLTTFLSSSPAQGMGMITLLFSMTMTTCGRKTNIDPHEI